MEHTAPAYSSDALDASAPRPVVANPILNDPRFQTLVRNRRAFSWSLTVLMLTVYVAFILTLAFSPALLGRPIVERLPATWGIPVGWWAIAGDYMSAASLLGIAALVFTRGYDGLTYSIGSLASWPIIVRAHKSTCESTIFPNQSSHSSKSSRFASSGTSRWQR